jgi:Rod binding domain-containing protein
MHSTPISPASLSPQMAPQLATPAANPGRGAKAAREFEAQLIGSLVESLEKTFASVPGEDSMPGADDYNYLGAQALAQAMAAHGGFGIAAMISRHLAPHEGK